MRADEGGARVVRVFHDWYAPWPLWEDGTEKYSMDPEDYGLSDDLTMLLKKCGDLFENCKNPDTGWTSKEKRDEYLRSMNEAINLLKVELSGIAEIREQIDEE